MRLQILDNRFENQVLFVRSGRSSEEERCENGREERGGCMRLQILDNRFENQVLFVRSGRSSEEERCENKEINGSTNIVSNEKAMITLLCSRKKGPPTFISPS